MRRAPSLFGRLLAALLVLTAIVTLVGVTAGFYSINREINEAMDSSMEAIARRLLPVVVDDVFKRDTLDRPVGLPDSLSEDEHGLLIYQVRDGNGRVLLHSHDAPPTPLTPSLALGFADRDGWRIFTASAVSETLFVQVAERASARTEETWEAALGFVLPIAVLTPVAAGLAWGLLRRLLSPVVDLRAEIGTRHSSNLAPLSSGGLPLELAAIAGSVNNLLQRLRMALDAEREFAANAAHELRTPIAGAMAQVDRLVAEASNDVTRHRGRQIRTALADLSAISEKLLQLARADAGVAVAGPPVVLGQIVPLVVGEWDRQVAARIVVRDMSEGVRTAIDMDAFAIVLRNLIGNALLHGSADDPVTITIKADATIAVINRGPPVAPEVLRRLAQRFERGGAAEKGTGLGLAIVARIVEQVGGRLTLLSPASGLPDGFEARVAFVPQP